MKDVTAAAKQTKAELAAIAETVSTNALKKADRWIISKVKTQNLLDDLKGILLVLETGWTKQASARTHPRDGKFENANCVIACSPRARCFCLTGAMDRVLLLDWFKFVGITSSEYMNYEASVITERTSYPQYHLLYKAIFDELPERYREGKGNTQAFRYSIQNWNDDIRTTAADVVALVRRAIATEEHKWELSRAREASQPPLTPTLTNKTPILSSPQKSVSSLPKPNANNAGKKTSPDSPKTAAGSSKKPAAGPKSGATPKINILRVKTSKTSASRSKKQSKPAKK